jgi:hypothetical protein
LGSLAHNEDVAETLHPLAGANEALSQAECLRQIDRMVASSLLQGSDALCRLLQYLAHHTLNFPFDHLKEYTIATELFGRPQDFDPQSDASIRVQIGRLRNKIAEYNSSIGIDDPVVVELPKGKHALSFQRRVRQPVPVPVPEPVSEPTPEPAATVAISEPETRRSSPRSLALSLAILASSLLVCGTLLYMVHARATSASVKQVAVDAVPAVFRTFWGPFLKGPEEPFLVYANANFVGTADSGMRYFDPVRDSRDQISQHYTGVGEVMGVLELQQLFQQLGGARFRVKRSGLFTLDDARDNNLIFVGSPTENLTLDQIPNTREFAFRRQPAGPNRWQEVIVDLHPGAGEASLYVPTPQTRPMEVDYAVVSLTRGLEHRRWTLILAGVSTVGTQAAVDFVCDKASLEQLLALLNPKGPRKLRPFEALLRVKVANDVPLQSQLVVLRRTDDAPNP